MPLEPLDDEVSLPDKERINQVIDEYTAASGNRKIAILERLETIISKIASAGVAEHKTSLYKMQTTITFEYLQLRQDSESIDQLKFASGAGGAPGTRLLTSEEWQKKTTWMLSLIYGGRPDEYKDIDNKIAAAEHAKSAYLISPVDANIKIFHDSLKQLRETILDVLTNPAIRVNRHRELSELLSSASIEASDLIQQSPSLQIIHRQQAKNDELDALIKPFQSMTHQYLQELQDDSFKDLREKNAAELASIEVKDLGAVNIKVYSMQMAESKFHTKVVFRLIPNDYNIKATETLRASDAGKHLAQQHLLKPFSYLSKTKVGDYLEISEFCSGGDLLQAAKADHSTVAARQAKAFAYTTNLIEMMCDFNKAKVFFADIKPSNFMLNDHGRIVISDTKSLFNTVTAKTTFDLKAVPTGYMISTLGYMSPEDYQMLQEKLANPPRNSSGQYTYNAIALQSYQLGVTIYELSTGHLIASEDRNQKDKHVFNFSSPAFKGETGNLLLAIVKGLTDTDPDKRLTVEAAAEMILAFNKANKLQAADNQGQPTDSTIHIYKSLVGKSPENLLAVATQPVATIDDSKKKDDNVINKAKHDIQYTEDEKNDSRMRPHR